MKLTAIILFACCMQVSATVFSQKINLSDKKAPLTKVLGQIAQQSGYSLFYDKELISSSTQVDVQVSNASVEQALDAALKTQPLTWAIVDQTIVIKQKQVPALDELKNKIKAELAQVTVVGKVTDELGNPMVGVTVKQKDNPNNGTITDLNGKYILNVPGDNTMISFSFVGYEPQELTAKNILPGSVVMLKVTSTNLREVSVYKGYYYERKETSTGDVGVISSKEIEEQPVSDPIQALEGRITGLNIQQTSGVPGAYDKIQIRGQNSIANGNDPLYVIDGVPFSSTSLTNTYFGGGVLKTPGASNNGYPSNSNGGGMSPFNALNPFDIESIEVLKDADATAIYGSRGANGVILITTKKGRAGTTKFNLNAQQGIGQVGHFLDMLNTQQYIAMRQEAFKNDGLSIPSIITNPADFYYDIDGFWNKNSYTNWQKVLIGGNAQFRNIQGELSGGTTNTQFLLGAGYNHQTTVFPGSYDDIKGSLHLTLNHNSIDQRFHLQFTVGYVNDHSNLPQTDFTSKINLAPDAPALYTPSGGVNWAMNNGSPTFTQNPIALINQKATAVTNNLMGSVALSYQILAGLQFATNAGYSHDEMNSNLLTPLTALYPPLNASSSNRANYLSNTENETWLIEPQISYKKTISKGQFNALIGGTFQQSTSTQLNVQASNFTSDALISNPQAGSTQAINSYNNTLYHYNAIYGRLGYSWADEYILNLTARRDGSSRFGPGNQFGDFGAIGAAWIFSREKFVLDNIKWLSFGKLRFSYGITGNDQIQDYQFLSTYSSLSNTYQGVAGLKPSGLTNPNFRWEEVKKMEFGMEIGLLKDRIDVDASYFRNRTVNQLVGEPLSSVTGYSSIEYNLPATLQNSGLELNINSFNIKSGAFNWRTTVNFTLPYNKLVAFDDLANTPYKSSLVVGKSIFIKPAINFLGINPQTGVYTYATQNLSGVPSNPQEYVFTQPITQKFFGGIANTFNYKALHLDVFVQFVKQFGYNYLNSFSPYLMGGNNTNEPTAVLARWQNPGDNASIGKFSNSLAADPRLLFSKSTGVYGDASFTRLKNISLSFDLPNEWQQTMHIQNSRIFLQGQNLATFTKYIGLDPETQGLTLPPLRVMTVGVNASF